MGGYAISNPATGQVYVPTTNTYNWQVFMVGADNQLYYATQDAHGTWSGFTSLGGYVISNPVIGVIANGATLPSDRLEVFVLGGDHQLYYNIENTVGTWSGFIRLGGYFISDPAVQSFVPTHLGDTTVVMAVAGDYSLWVNRQDNNGAWSGFTNVGGYVIGKPALTFNIEGRVQAFVVGGDHALYTIAETAEGSGTYSSFAYLGGYVIGNPAVFRTGFCCGPGVLYMGVFVVGGPANALYLNKELTSNGVGTWSGFESLGSYRAGQTGTPVAIRDATGRIHAFVIGGDHAVYHLSGVDQASDTWIGFENLGGYVIGDPSASGSSIMMFELLVIGADHGLYYNANPTFPY